MRFVCLLVWLLFIEGPCSGETFTVCEVLAKATALDGKVISVRGVWYKGDTGESLDAESPCEHPTARDGWRFWDTIEMIPDRGKDAVAWYYSERRDLGKRHRGEDVKLVGVVTGKLEAREHFVIHTFPSGEQVPEAYRYSAARLRYTGVKELRAIPMTKEEIDKLSERSHKPWPTKINQ